MFSTQWTNYSQTPAKAEILLNCICTSKLQEIAPWWCFPIKTLYLKHWLRYPKINLRVWGCLMSGVGFRSKLCTCNCTSLTRAASAPHPRNGDSDLHPPPQLPCALCAGALTPLDTQTSLLSGDAAAQLKSQWPQQWNFWGHTLIFLAELVQQSCMDMDTWITSEHCEGWRSSVTWDLPEWHHCQPAPTRVALPRRGFEQEH